MPAPANGSPRPVPEAAPCLNLQNDKGAAHLGAVRVKNGSVCRADAWSRSLQRAAEIPTHRLTASAAVRSHLLYRL